MAEQNIEVFASTCHARLESFSIEYTSTRTKSQQRSFIESNVRSFIAANASAKSVYTHDVKPLRYI